MSRAAAKNLGDLTADKSQSFAPDRDILSGRLAYALAALKISQSELARRIGVKPQAIQYLCSHNVKNSSFTYDIADALEIEYTWLAAGEGQMLASDEPEITEFHTPILPWGDAIAWKTKQLDYHPNTHQSWTVTNNKVNENCFALVVEDNAMAPRFDAGATLIIDPLAKPYDGCFVIAYIKAHNIAVLRQYNQQGKHVMLQPTNQSLYKSIPLSKDDTICGIVIQAHFDYRA